MNETFNYLRANGIYSLEDLEHRVSEHSAATESLKKTLDEQTARMKAIKQLYDSSAAFQSLKPVYDGLQKIKFEKPRAKYKAEHEAEGTRVLIHEKSSLAPPGQSLAFSLGDEKGFEWIGAYDITADELLAGADNTKTESKTAQAQMLILELLADGKRMPSAELEKAVNERGISSRTMRTAKSRIGDRLVTEKDGTAWVCYLRN